MKKSILFDLLKLITLFGLIWAGFTFIPLFSIDKDDFSLSVEKEEKLGRILVDAITSDKKNKILHNPAIDSAIFVITKRLTDSIGLTDYEYHIKVIDSPVINAFTLPGGNIFIYSGLIKFSENPEEVAAVLAHEIGHAEERHVVQKLVKELGITVLFSAIGGNQGMVLKEIGRTAASTVFDREQEKDADNYAFKLLDKSGINPKALATFFRRLNSEVSEYNENMEILMTHPNNNSRIKASLEYKTSKKFKDKTFGLNWDKVKTSLNAGEDSE